MGTWGAGSFDNDSVLDWLADVIEDGEPDVVRKALAAAADADADGYLDADEAQPALAAAEIVAAAIGRGDDRIADEDELLAWLSPRREAFGAADVALARRAVEHVLAKSELQELWEENGPDTKWRPVVTELLRRLQPADAEGAPASGAESVEKPAAKKLTPKKPAAKKPAAKEPPAKKLTAKKAARK